MDGAVSERAGEILCTALESAGFGKLCGRPTPFVSEGSLGFVAFLILILPIAVTLGIRIHWLLAFAPFVLFFVTAVRLGGDPTYASVVLLLLVAGWAATGIWQYRTTDTVGLTHGLPLALLLPGLIFRLDRRALARSLPLLAPLVLLVLLVPLLTAEVWQAAAGITSERVVLLFVFLVGPVLIVLFRRLRDSFFRVYGQTLASIDFADEEIRGEVGELVSRRTTQEDGAWLRDAALPVLSEQLTEETQPTFGAQIAITLHGQLSRTLVRRLLPTAVSVGLFVSAYLYVIAAAAIPRGVAADWSQEGVPVERIELGLDVTLPGGPYIAVALMLGIAATAIFLALVLTDDRYADALSDALLHEPAHESLMLGLPYLATTGGDVPDPQPDPGDGASAGSASA